VGHDSVCRVKTSFLLPTRNRLDYLKLAVETVRRQESGEWEIAISDNDSDEDIAGYVAALGDERILYRRTERFLPVTENWNAALEMSTGDYVLMLGDDDGLLPDSLAHFNELIERFRAPEMLYVGSLLFTYPGVDPSGPHGFVASNAFADFFAGASGPFVLDREQALAAVHKAMSLKLSFNFNMQLSLLSRPLIERLREHGEVFQSQFPDYYASCAALLTARRIVADPRPAVVVGVSPKSYGFFHLNDRETEGRAFLDAEAAAPRQLPGSNINEGWLSAVEALEHNFGSEYGLKVDRRRYRYMQAAQVYARRFRGRGTPEELAALEEKLPPIERLGFRAADAVGRALATVLPDSAWQRLVRVVLGQFPKWAPARRELGLENMLELFEYEREHRRTDEGSLAGDAASPGRR
jgi:glycosyltransferase involved in cell wall biosynthesis